MTEKSYPIPESVLNEILSILGNLPYMQVASTIGKIQAIAQAPVPEAPKEKK